MRRSRSAELRLRRKRFLFGSLASELEALIGKTSLVTEESLSRKRRLFASMSLTQFDHGYWYATELKAFADELGIASAARLRKDQLERAIKEFLRFGTVAVPERVSQMASSRPRQRDVDLGLRLGRRVIRDTNDAVTKVFLEREAIKLSATFRPRSGAKYRLNRWREEQIQNGVALTYRDVVAEYVRLSQSAERVARIPHGRHINFIGDLLARQPGATNAEAIWAWRSLKKMDCPKTYRDWHAAKLRKP